MMSKDTKIRKTIRSNPFGFRIHSPFVYRLVTRGLFGRTALTPGNISFLKNMSFRERCTTRRIINLITYLRPGKVTVYGTGIGFPFSQAGPAMMDEKVKKRQVNDLPGVCDELTVLYEVPPSRIPYSERRVLVLVNLRDTVIRKLFDEMILNPLVSVTLETMGTGFVFFDPLLQKEHYVISRFYLW